MLAELGLGPVSDRYTAEVNVSGSTAYTSTWGRRGPNDGNAVFVWNVSGNVPVLVDSIILDGATIVGDVQVVPGADLLAIATERFGGSFYLYDISIPTRPVFVSRFSSPHTFNGVHTAEVQPVNGTPYAFLCIDPAGAEPARLTILDLSDPAEPREVFSQPMGNPFVHDTFVRDGILFTAEWNDGIGIWDIGGGGQGGSPSAPVRLGRTLIVGGQAHNVWWFHDPSIGSARFLFVGEEGPGSTGSASSGDIHVVDVSDFANPREVAFFHIPGAGTHNFSLDEPSGVLYAAYYNAGVRAIDVRGDLSDCAAGLRDANGRCDLTREDRVVAHWPPSGGRHVYVWGVQKVGPFIYASDMLNGLWKLAAP